MDVGIGDAVVPPPTWIDYPGLLDFPRPRLRAYSPATVIAEKLHAIVTLGLRNSRMKDYFDLHVLAGNSDPANSDALAQAIAATFARRQTAIPQQWPPGLGNEFAGDQMKQTQWQAFLDKNQVNAPSLPQVVHALRRFLETPLSRARQMKDTRA